MFHYPLIRLASWLARPIGRLAAACALLIFIAYPMGIEILYRPLSGGPATHPLTALALFMLALPVACWRQGWGHRLVLPLAIGAFAIGALRLHELTFGLGTLAHLTPFQAMLDIEELGGKPIRMGMNTAAMTTLFALALILETRRRHLASQLFAFFGLGFPAVAATGYAYGLKNFHGQMALSTVVVALLIGAGVLALGAHRGVLKAMLSPWVGGRIARVQLVLAYLVPFAVGYFLVSMGQASADQLFGLFVVVVSGFIVVLVVFSAVFQEYVDRRRRGAERRLAVAATVDPLTDTANRRLLMQTATREFDRAQRLEQPLSLLMVDVDRFKDLNDQHGHAAGDMVLNTIARAMQATLRKQDLLARYGGEEFVILLPDTALGGAVHLAEKIRARIEGTLFPDNVGRVTVSIGCAENHRVADLHELLVAADKALYAAKALGRNRVEALTGSEVEARAA